MVRTHARLPLLFDVDVTTGYRKTPKDIWIRGLHHPHGGAGSHGSIIALEEQMWLEPVRRRQKRTAQRAPTRFGNKLIVAY